MPEARIYNVLFLCTGNSARSIFAEVLLNRLGRDSNAAKETCPAWPGQPLTAHWGVDDPAAVAGTDVERERAFRQTYLVLAIRIRLFTSLRPELLDRLSLETALRRIGESSTDKPPP